MEAPLANPTEVTRIIWNAIEEQGLDGGHFLDISLLLSSPKSTSSCNYSTRHDTSGSGAITTSSGADTITHILKGIL